MSEISDTEIRLNLEEKQEKSNQSPEFLTTESPLKT